MNSILFLIVAIGLYFLPTIIAEMCGKRNTLAIGILNTIPLALCWFFGGWLLVIPCWFAALIWAATGDRETVVVKLIVDTTTGQMKTIDSQPERIN